MTSIRHRTWLLGVVLLSGCGLVVSHQVNDEVRALSVKVDDLETLSGIVKTLPPPPRGTTTGSSPLAGQSEPNRETPKSTPPANEENTSAAPDDELQQVAFTQLDKLPPARKRLLIPPGLPGADASAFEMPDDPKEKQRYIDRLYAPVPELPPMRPPAPGPEGHPLSLAELQRLGETYSPAIKNAIAAIEAAKAAAYDVGMYPNPSVAYEHDTVETGPAGYPGFYIDQIIKTGGKLTVQQAAATMDVLNAKLALRRAKADLWTQIRGNYFAVLVALQSIRINEALFKFAEDLYEVQVEMLRFKFAAGYEPMQLRPLVLQARLNIIQARNQYAASWRQLAASLGLPDMPPTELAGRLDMPIPALDYNEVVARLGNHTDVRTALVNVQKAKYGLQFQKLVPLPDVGARLLVQKDYTTPPNQVAHSAIMYMTLPLWDQNRGGVRQAEWQLAQAAVGPAQARNTLIGTLADAFNRYLTTRQQVGIALQQVQDMVRVYQGAWLRHQKVPQEVSFSDLFPIQQALGGYVSGYVTALGLQWQAVVDVVNLLQTEDLFQAGKGGQVVPLAPLEDLLTPLRNFPRAPIAKNAPAPHASPQAADGHATATPAVAAPTPTPSASRQRPAPQGPTPEPSPPPDVPALSPLPASEPRRTAAALPAP